MDNEPRNFADLARKPCPSCGGNHKLTDYLVVIPASGEAGRMIEVREFRCPVTRKTVVRPSNRKYIWHGHPDEHEHARNPLFEQYDPFWSEKENDE